MKISTNMQSFIEKRAENVTYLHCEAA